MLLCVATVLCVGTVLALRTRAERAARVSVVIDTSKAHQRIEGFGAATAFYQNWIVDHPSEKALYKALFADLGLEFLRLRNSYEPLKPEFAKADRQIVAGATEALGHPIRLMMASWSPPAALKSNGTRGNGGTLSRRGDRYDYAGYGRYWRESLQAYAAQGIVPEYISIQNEPDYLATWDSCLLGAQETATQAGYDKAFDAVVESLKGLPSAPKLVGPDTLGIGGDKPERYFPPSDTARLAKLGAIAHHLYDGGTHLQPDSFLPRMRAIRDAYPTVPKFQTEFSRSDGFQTAWLIHNTLAEEDASAYIYWAALWPGEDCLISLEEPWKRASWKTPQGFALTDRYFALKHYAYFLDTGFVRVEATVRRPELRASAYLSPDQKTLVIVVLNTATTKTYPLDLAVTGFSERRQRVFRTTEALGERFQEQRGTVSLPPHSIATVVLDR